MAFNFSGENIFRTKEKLYSTDKNQRNIGNSATVARGGSLRFYLISLPALPDIGEGYNERNGNYTCY